jgi:glycerophosphoryl diester phosphodiesterase
LALALSLFAGVPVTAENPFLRDAKQPRDVWNIAHAGASSIAPQNTLAAGQTAFDLGADVWSVDVRRTADGVLILMHDETLDRTTDVEARFPERSPWRVETFALEEIRSLDAGAWFVEDDPFGEIAAGHVSTDDLARFASEPVPTLREALDLVVAYDGLIDIEIKPIATQDREQIAQRLVDLIVETESADRVMISSFDHDLLHAIGEIDPDLPLGALSIFAPPDTLAYLDNLGADVYLPSLVAYTDRLLAELAAAGIGVHVWTYNTVDQLDQLARTPGITGIVTDFPQRLAPILEELVRGADS